MYFQKVKFNKKKSKPKLLKLLTLAIELAEYKYEKSRPKLSMSRSAFKNLFSSSKFCLGHNFNTFEVQDLKLGTKEKEIKQRSMALVYFYLGLNVLSMSILVYFYLGLNVLSMSIFLKKYVVRSMYHLKFHIP